MGKKLLMIFVSCAILFTIGCKKEGVSLIKVAIWDTPTVEKTRKWISTMERGQVVKIVEEQKDGSWMKVQLADGKTQGWVEKRYVHKGKKQVVEFTDKTKLYPQPDSASRPKGEIPKGTKALVLEKKDAWYLVNIKFNYEGWVKGDGVKEGVSPKDEGDKVEVYISGVGKCLVEASSTLIDNSGYSYSVNNLFDRNPGTTWQDGVDGTGVGEWIEITLPKPMNLSASVINGFARIDPKYAQHGAGGDLYVLNNRVKTMRIEYWDAGDSENSKTVRFEDDVRGYQDAGVFENVARIRFIIDSVYKGDKWPDTCIGEIKLEKASDYPMGGDVPDGRGYSEEGEGVEQ